MRGAREILIEARGLTKRYGAGGGAVTALDGASFTVREGEFVAIMGPSGSGKSSLMNLIGLLDSPSGGALHLKGRDVAKLSPSAQAEIRNRHIGFIFQAYHLMARRSALGNVELPLIYRGIRRKERLRLAEEALAGMGLTGRANAYPAEMSGGEQQRVAIARALVSDPELIVADEPTGALDTTTGDQILKLLQEVCAAGRTVILVTHDPAVAAKAKRLIRVHDGRIIEDGPLPSGLASLSTLPAPRREVA